MYFMFNLCYIVREHHIMADKCSIYEVHIKTDECDAFESLMCKNYMTYYKSNQPPFIVGYYRYLLLLQHSLSQEVLAHILAEEKLTFRFLTATPASDIVDEYYTIGQEIGF